MSFRASETRSGIQLGIGYCNPGFPRSGGMTEKMASAERVISNRPPTLSFHRRRNDRRGKGRDGEGGDDEETLGGMTEEAEAMQKGVNAHRPMTRNLNIHAILICLVLMQIRRPSGR